MSRTRLRRHHRQAPAERTGLGRHFGLVFALSADRRHVWPWADSIAFWAMNAGPVAFMVGLISETATIKEIGAPVMGLAIVLGLATAARRLARPDLQAAVAT